ncbi:MAG: PKD domain-containing protein [Bacteroidales bacterium]|nr:PKD domain-containing protein [Bacteroidales bacterium]
MAQPCPVNPDISYSQYCDSLEFINNSTFSGGVIDSVLWQFGDGFESKLDNPNHTYTSEGEYYISLTVYHSSLCDTTAYDTVHIFHPVAGFWSDTVCFGSQTAFHDTSLPVFGQLTAWEWDFGDGISNQQNPFHAFTLPGPQTVQLIAFNDLGCSDTIVSTAIVDSLPDPLFSYSPPCLGIQTCFYSNSLPNSGEIVNWIWTIDYTTQIFGEDTICWIFTDPGKHYVFLTVSNSNGCTATKIDSLMVYHPPVADFSSSVTCFKDSTWFVNQTNTQGIEILNWKWNFNDPPSGTANTSGLYEPSHYFTSAGIFNVKLIAENIYGCTDTVVKPVTVDTLPEALFTFTDVAVGVQTEFTDISIPHGSPIINTFWDFGDGTTASNPNPVLHTYNASGLFNVMLVVTDVKNCSDTIVQQINVTGLPFADFDYTSVNLTANFNDLSVPVLPSIPVSSWSWNFGVTSVNTDTSSLQNPFYTYPESGYYNVFLEVMDINGGIDDTTIMIYVGDALIANFKGLHACRRTENLFIDKSESTLFADIAMWYWNFGDGTDTTYTVAADTIRHIYPVNGLYSVMLVIFDNVLGNPVISDTMIDTVMVFAAPTAHFDTVGVCFGDPTLFKDLSAPNGVTISQWFWDFGDGSTAYGQNPQHLYPAIGTYNVKLKVTNTLGCNDTTSNYAYVNYAPNPYFEILDQPCVDSPIRFMAYYDSLITTVSEWNWYFHYPEDDSIWMAYEQNPVFQYSSVAVHEVRLIASAFGCKQDTAREILVYPVPFSEFDIQENYGAQQGRTFFANRSIFAENYFWDFGNGNTSTTPSPIEVYEEDSTYLVTLISYNEYGCSDTSMHEVEIYFRGLYIPTAFSPNNPNSDVALFSPKGINIQEYLIQVYDLRGNLLWESEAVDEYGRPTESWDGYYEDRLMPSGTYVWKAKAVFRDNSYWEGLDYLDDEEKVKQGTVTLLR